MLVIQYRQPSGECAGMLAFSVAEDGGRLACGGISPPSTPQDNIEVVNGFGRYTRMPTTWAYEGDCVFEWPSWPHPDQILLWLHDSGSNPELAPAESYDVFCVGVSL